MNKNLIACVICLALLLTPSNHEKITDEPYKANTIRLSEDQNVITTNRNLNSIVVGDSLADTEQKRLKENIRRSQELNSLPDDREYSSIRDEIHRQASERWGDSEALQVLWITDQESSGGNQYERNGQCLGAFQRYYPDFTEEETQQYLNDVQRQIQDGLDYIQSGSRNFHTPSEAKEFWLKNKERTGSGWY